MLQEIITSKNSKGTVQFTKSLLQAIGTLNAISPRTVSLFLTLCTFLDDNNSIITNMHTLAVMLNTNIQKIEYCLRMLKEREIIYVKNVYINHSKSIVGKIHDKSLYYSSNKTVWKPVEDKYIGEIILKEKYMRISINKDIVSCTNGYYNTFIVHIKKRLYYDARLTENDIIK